MNSSSNYKDDTFGGSENIASFNFPSSIAFGGHILDSSFPERPALTQS